MGDSPTIAPQTAEKYLNMTRAFLNWCESEGHIDKAPGSKIIVDFKMKGKPRLPFSDDEMVSVGADTIPIRKQPD